MAAVICVSDSWNLAGPSHVESRQFSVTLSVFHQPALSTSDDPKPHNFSKQCLP